jgi:hypothetical protein
MIYTLDYIEKEARNIQGAWNGEDDRFMYDGEVMHEEHVNKARELEEKIQEVRWLISELDI